VELVRILFAVHNCIERSVFTEVKHPAISIGFAYQVIFNNILHPVACLRISEINHSEIYAYALNQVSLTSRILDKVTESLPLLKQISLN
jgi:hypothetical protein